MRFTDWHVFRQDRFSVGMEEESQRPFLGFPVSNRRVDYTEWYVLPQSLLDGAPDNLEALRAFAAECRAHLRDDLLFEQPGSDRGTPT